MVSALVLLPVLGPGGWDPGATRTPSGPGLRAPSTHWRGEERGGYEYEHGGNTSALRHLRHTYFQEKGHVKKKEHVRPAQRVFRFRCQVHAGCVTSEHVSSPGETYLPGKETLVDPTSKGLLRD